MDSVLWVNHLGRRVGTLRRHHNQALSWFCYEEGWLADQERFSISGTLPLQEGDIETSFFTNLIFEGASRERIAKAIGISPENSFELLKRFGEDIAGALQIIDPTRAPSKKGAGLLHIDSNDEALFQTKAGFIRFFQESGMRLSLAGAQNKIAVVKTPEGLAIPLDGSPTTHILKLPNPEFKGLVENEAATLRCAKALGLHTVSCEIVLLGETPLLLVERYDRSLQGSVRRLHQEDFCQVLGLPAELKYEAEGGPSLADCFSIVRGAVKDPLGDTLSLIDWVLFNLLVHNSDAHAKNLSFVYDGARALSLAPYYDLVCTGAYGELDHLMAMRLGGLRDGGQVGVKALLQFALDIDVKLDFILGRLLGMAERLPFVFEAEMAGVALEAGGFVRGQQVLECVRRRVRSVVGKL